MSHTAVSSRIAQQQLGNCTLQYLNIRPMSASSYKHNASHHLWGVKKFSTSTRSPPAPPKHGVLGDVPKVKGSIDHPVYGLSNLPTSLGGLNGIQGDSPLSGASAEGGQGIVEPRPEGVGRRRRSTNAQNRLAITNISEKDAAEETNPQGSKAAQKNGPTAEREKEILYGDAAERVKKVQRRAAMVNATAASDIPSGVTSTTTPPSKKSFPWPTAEIEKVRLFIHAQATAERTQKYGVSAPSIQSRSSSEASSPASREKPISASAVPGPTLLSRTALLQQTVSSISSNVNNRSGTPNSQLTPPSPPSSVSRAPHYSSAEGENAALKRYLEAKLAVDRNQNVPFLSRDGTITDSLAGTTAPVAYESEKEKLRRQCEALDAAALAAQAHAQGKAEALPSHVAEAPSHTGPPPRRSGLSEKEILRRKLEEQDRIALLLQQQRQQQELEQPIPLQTPSRTNISRSPPIPPALSGSKPLTATEEKAQLCTKYEAEKRASVNGHALDATLSRYPYATATLASETPPPLMPRPPPEYIRETQEVDLRGRYYDSLGVGLASALDALTPLQTPKASLVSNPRLDPRSFSPFDVGLGHDTRSVVSPTPVHGHVWHPLPSFPAARY